MRAIRLTVSVLSLLQHGESGGMELRVLRRDRQRNVVDENI